MAGAKARYFSVVTGRELAATFSIAIAACAPAASRRCPDTTPIAPAVEPTSEPQRPWTGTACACVKPAIARPMPPIEAFRAGIPTCPPGTPAKTEREEVVDWNTVACRDACLPDLRPEEDRDRLDLIGIGDFRRWPFTRILGELGDRSLWSERERFLHDEAYRITIDRAHGGGVSYRFAPDGRDSATLTLRVSSACGLDGGDSGQEVLLPAPRTIPALDWRAFRRCMDGALWQIDGRDETGGLDGQEVLVEGIRKGRYRAITRWGSTDAEECIRTLPEKPW